MATLEFLATDANDWGNFPEWERSSQLYFGMQLCIYFVYPAFSPIQTFLFRFKFEGEKLITLGVGLHQNDYEEDNFLKYRIIVKSELITNVQGRYRKGNVRICQFMHSIFKFFGDI